jgi:hypothetical protein
MCLESSTISVEGVGYKLCTDKFYPLWIYIMPCIQLLSTVVEQSVRGILVSDSKILKLKSGDVHVKVTDFFTTMIWKH